jgi:hypothetical protein
MWVVVLRLTTWRTTPDGGPFCYAQSCGCALPANLHMLPPATPQQATALLASESVNIDTSPCRRWRVSHGLGLYADEPYADFTDPVQEPVKR